MSTITKERIELFIKSPLENGLTRGEQMELARIALASLEAEKVTLYRERNPYNGMTTGWQELTEQEYEFVKDNASENAEFRTVYTAPPAPVIQADVAQAIENLKQKSVECNRYNYCADAVKGVEDACLAAMLQGSQPVSQTYRLNELSGNNPVTPDGWVMVPKRLTAENGAKGALSGEFSETTFISCPECFGDDDCDTCDGSGRIEIKIPVTWTTIKSIWDKGIAYFAAEPPQEVK